MPSHPSSRSRPRALHRGFSLIELVTAIAIIGILAGLTLGAFSSVKGMVARRSMVTDLYSQLSLARNRAFATERMQIVVIKAPAVPNGDYGYYYFEDAANPPGLFNGAQLAALMTAMTNPPVVPAGYTLTLRDQRQSATNGFYLNADAWGGPLPFPWTPIAPVKLDTSISGCSFCTAGYGAVGFLASGRVVFSDNNALGGFVVLSGDAGSGTSSVRSAIGISPLGFTQQVEHP